MLTVPPLPYKLPIDPNRLRARREAANLTQEQAGRATWPDNSHPLQQWNSYETGRVTTPRAPTLNAMAAVLRCDPADLLVVPPPAPTPDADLQAAYIQGRADGVAQGRKEGYSAGLGDGRNAAFMEIAAMQARHPGVAVVLTPPPTPRAGPPRCNRCDALLAHDGTGHVASCPTLAGNMGAALAALTG